MFFVMKRRKKPKLSHDLNCLGFTKKKKKKSTNYLYELYELFIEVDLAATASRTRVVNY